MDGETFLLKSVYDAVIKQMIAIKGKKFKPEHILLKDRFGKQYLVSEINLHNCIKNDHIIFCSYYPNDEITNPDTVSFGVAVPIALYAGIELYSTLPKNLEQKYKNKGTKIGFNKTS